MNRQQIQLMMEKHLVNHMAIVLDESTSMFAHRKGLVDAVDNLIKHMAAKSQELEQETRISVWIFSGHGTVQCIIWDMDVLRLPSITKFYEPNGNTALIDAALKSIKDLKTTSQIYGNHSFLMYVFTDGEENNSYSLPSTLSREIAGLEDNWTVAALVPNEAGAREAERFGFSRGNIQTWDANTKQGLEEARQAMTTSLDSYMTARSTGLKSTTGLFDMSVNAVNKQTIAAAGLAPLDRSEYILTTVVYGNGFRDGDDWISAYTTNVLGHQYVAGRGYYQLTLAPVKVQVQKDIAIVEKKSGKVYTGKNARALLGLPDMTVTLKADHNPDYDIFIQSTSSNRKLLVGQKYLYLTPQVTYVKGQTVAPTPAKAAPKVAKMPRVGVPVAAGSGGKQSRQANGRFGPKV